MIHKDRPEATGESIRCKIRVNEQIVSIEGPSHTAGTIKQAAVEQGVEIDLDFVLSVITEGNETKILGEEEVIEVTEESCFVAVAGDDNS